MTTRNATPAMTRAYLAGRDAARMGLAEWTYSGAGDSMDLCDPVIDACFEAGRLGREMPVWSHGWRYGRPPARGQSYNHREQRLEAGVSMMQVAGSDAQPDPTYEIFNGSQPRVECEGWLVTHTTGTDGEPLLVGAEVV